MNARFHCMFWKPDGVCSGIYCDATEKFQPIKPWKDSFFPQGDKYSGRPITPLPVVLNNDLSRLESSTHCLKTLKDIENLKKITEQRDQWRILCRCSLAAMMRNGDKSVSQAFEVRYQHQYQNKNVLFKIGLMVTKCMFDSKVIEQCRARRLTRL